MKLTVIGTVFVDIKGYPIGEFIPTGRNAGRIEQFHGGVGRNIAEDVKKLGADTTFVSLVDDDGIGLGVIEHLNKIGVNTEFVRRTPNGMGTWLAIFDKKGEVCANISKRPELLPMCDILEEEGDRIIENTDAVLLEIDMDEEIISKTFELCEKYGKKVFSVISNMTIAKERMEYIKKSECFICNRQEAGLLFNEPTLYMDKRDMLDILKIKIKEMGIKSMVVTMDELGCVYADNASGENGICDANKVKVVDTTGAGDSFFAGTCVGLTKGMNYKEACIFATDVASKVIASLGNVVTEM